MAAIRMKAENMQEVLKLKDQYGRRAGFLSGGTEINRENSSCNYEVLIELCRNQNGGDHIYAIQHTEIGIEVGACVTFQEGLDSGMLPNYLNKALRYADIELLREKATFGGNIALLRYDSYLLPVLIAAKARVIMADIDEEGEIIEESVPIREFLEHHDLYSQTLITKICMDKPERFAASERVVSQQKNSPVLVVGFGTDVSKTDETLSNTRIAVGTAGYGIYRLLEVEEALDQGAVRTAADLEKIVLSQVRAVSDKTGTGEEKKKLAGKIIADLYRSGCKSAGLQEPL